MKITFGKHKGTHVEQIPISYLIWAKDNISSHKWRTVLIAEYLRRTTNKPLHETYKLSKIWMNHQWYSPMNQLKVCSKPCDSCPFEGKKPVRLLPHRLDEIYRNIVNLQGQHYCHSSDNKLICRGARNLQVKILYIIGIIPELSNESFEETMQQHLRG